MKSNRRGRGCQIGGVLSDRGRGVRGVSGGGGAVGVSVGVSEGGGSVAVLYKKSLSLPLVRPHVIRPPYLFPSHVPPQFSMTISFFLTSSAGYG